VQFSLTYAGAWQGRYLYSVMLPWALLFAGGVSRGLRFGGGVDGVESEVAAANSRWVIAALALVLVVIDALALVKLAFFFAEAPAGRWLLFNDL